MIDKSKRTHRIVEKDKFLPMSAILHLSLLPTFDQCAIGVHEINVDHASTKDQQFTDRSLNISIPIRMQDFFQAKELIYSLKRRSTIYSETKQRWKQITMASP